MVVACTAWLAVIFFLQDEEVQGMIRRTLIVTASSVALAAGLVLGAPSASASKAGVVAASASQTAAIAQQIKLDEPAECISIFYAKSSKRWAVMQFKAPVSKKCEKYAFDGYNVLRQKSAKKPWRFAGIGGSSVPCSALKSQLADKKAPASVFRDFRAAGYCER
jgi:hypothetical protein